MLKYFDGDEKKTDEMMEFVEKEAAKFRPEPEPQPDRTYGASPDAWAKSSGIDWETP